MFKRTRSISFLPFVIALSLIAPGCSSSSNNNGGNEGAPTIVTVTDYSGIRVPNATVVLGDNNGAMKAHGVTDADGQITFDNTPVNATITAATTCLRSGSTTTTYSINVQFDVNGSAVLSLDNCSSTNTIGAIGPPGSLISYPSSTPLGTITVNITNTPSEVSHHQLTIGRHSHIFENDITGLTVSFYEGDLNSNGKFSALLTGDDDHNNTIAYGILLDQNFTDGMTVDIQMAPMSFLQYQISNLPATAVNLQAFLSMNVYSSLPGFWSNQSYSLLSAPSSTIVKMPYIPGLSNGGSYQIFVDLDKDHDGVSDASQSLTLRSSASLTSNQIFDLSEALSAPSVKVIDAETATPTFSWSEVDPASTSIYLTASMSSSTAYWSLSFSNLNRSRTSIRYPELPDSLAPFRPSSVRYFSVYTSASEGNLYKSSSGGYLSAQTVNVTTR